MPHLKNSIVDPKWRVRSEALHALVDIAVAFEVNILINYIQLINFF